MTFKISCCAVLNNFRHYLKGKSSQWLKKGEVKGKSENKHEKSNARSYSIFLFLCFRLFIVANGCPSDRRP